MSILSSNLKKARHHIGLSQEKAARALRISRPTLGAWEEGRSRPPITHLPVIMDIYEITDWRGFLLSEHFDPAHQSPSRTIAPHVSSIESNYKKLRGRLKDVADLLLKSH